MPRWDAPLSAASCWATITTLIVVPVVYTYLGGAVATIHPRSARDHMAEGMECFTKAHDCINGLDVTADGDGGGDGGDGRSGQGADEGKGDGAEEVVDLKALFSEMATKDLAEAAAA